MDVPSSGRLDNGLELDPQSQQAAESQLIVLKRLVRLWRAQSIADAPAETVAIATPTLDGDVRAAGVTLREWQRSRRELPAAYVEMTASGFAALRDRDPARRKSTTAAAERILRHE